MGYYCRYCGRTRRNEKFSGKGRKKGICKDCTSIPRAERDKIDRMEALWGFVDQSRISEKNLAYLRECRQHADSEVQHLALLLIKLREVSPHRKKRWRKVKHAAPSLFRACESLGLLDEWYSNDPMHTSELTHPSFPSLLPGMELLAVYDDEDIAEAAAKKVAGPMRLASDRDDNQLVYRLFGTPSWTNFYALEMFELPQLKAIIQQRAAGQPYDAQEHARIISSLSFLESTYNLKIPERWR